MVTAAAAGGELHDHSGAVLGDAGLHLREELRIGAGVLLGVAPVAVDDGGARLIGRVGGLDLLRGRDGDGGRVLLAWDGAGNGHRDHRGRRPSVLPSQSSSADPPLTGRSFGDTQDRTTPCNGKTLPLLYNPA